MVPADAPEQGLGWRCPSIAFACSLPAVLIPSRGRARRISLAAAALAPLALGGCGGDDSGSAQVTAPANATIVVEALNLKFDQDAYTATAGDQVIAYLGLDAQRHTLAVLDAEKTQVGEEVAVDKGDVATIEEHLPAGEYTLICTVPGHAAAGMVAPLSVR